jgi:hypothetical protein
VDLVGHRRHVGLADPRVVAGHAVLDLGAAAPVEGELDVAGDAVAPVAGLGGNDVPREARGSGAGVGGREIGVEVAPAVSSGQIARRDLEGDPKRVAGGHRDARGIEHGGVAVVPTAQVLEDGAARGEAFSPDEGLPLGRIAEHRPGRELRDREAAVGGEQVGDPGAVLVGHPVLDDDTRARDVDRARLDLELAVAGGRARAVRILVDVVGVVDRPHVPHREGSARRVAADAALDSGAVVDLRGCLEGQKSRESDGEKQRHDSLHGDLHRSVFSGPRP